jgi:transposase
MNAMTVAVDLAKDVFEVAVANRAGRITERKRLTRRQFEPWIDALPAGTTVVMEACSMAHYWGRRCVAHGRAVRLLPPQYVRPYVRRNKTDRADADGLLEAHRGGGIQAVAIKTVEQQTLQTLHRVRTQGQAARTARLNVMRGVLREYGITLAVGARTAMRRIPALLDDTTSSLPALVRASLAMVLEEVRALEARVAQIDQQLGRIAREQPIARRLQQVPGVGVITATALMGAVGDIHAFRRGRQFASWLGLTPRESSSGTRRYLGRISKRGDVYLRCLLTHGSRAVLLAAQRAVRVSPHRATRFQQWAAELAIRRGPNKAAIAIANKLARLVWVVWHRDVDFDASAPCGAAAA